jgi:hypothetical protein
VDKDVLFNLLKPFTTGWDHIDEVDLKDKLLRLSGHLLTLPDRIKIAI